MVTSERRGWDVIVLIEVHCHPTMAGGRQGVTSTYLDQQPATSHWNVAAIYARRGTLKYAEWVEDCIRDAEVDLLYDSTGTLKASHIWSNS